MTARLLVIERRMPERAEAGVSRDAFMTDLEMLVMTPGGRERTETELQAIFAAAGFQHVRTSPTASTLSVFEARPIEGGGGLDRPRQAPARTVVNPASRLCAGEAMGGIPAFEASPARSRSAP
jgi:O-methyltransferase domain